MKQKLTWLMMLFIGLFLTHFVGFLIYFSHHKTTIARNYRDTIVQEVMNLIHMVQATPEPQLSKAIETVDSSHVDISLSDNPLYKTRVTDLTFWRINKLVGKNPKSIELSLSVPGRHWVNVKAAFNQSPQVWLHILILLTELAIAMIVFFVAWSISRFTEPLKEFQKAAERLGVSFKTTTLEEYKGPPVIRETAQVMNKMQQRIKDLINDRTMMLAAISHDLRTPITRLKLRAHMFDDDELTNKTLNDLDEMEMMISEVLTFSKNENDNEVKRKLDLSSLIETICNDIADLGHPVTFNKPAKRLPYNTRELTLKRALTNLIQNAIKYGKEAIVQVKSNHKQITITVEDNGPGIPEKEIEQVFTPFYRCDHSRSRKIAGTGLGLAIAQSAIRAHGGDIILKNKKPNGLLVTVILPY